LLEADVNYKIVKEVIKSVEEEARREKVIESLTPAEQIITILYRELLRILGESEPLYIAERGITLIMLVGLQGNGKTTTSAKLARYLTEKGKRALLIPFDFKRPAAREQLITLAQQNNLIVFEDIMNSPVPTLKKALSFMEKSNINIGIIDTAGRKEIDEEMMNELRDVYNNFSIQEVLFVSDSTIGQGALKVAKGFNEVIPLTGAVFTKFDSSAKGGSILSFRYVTGKPIKFIGTGEKINNIEVFYPDRVISRIVGRGDVATLAEKASKAISQEESKEILNKIKNDTFDLNDFARELQGIKKMGGFSSVLSSLPVIPGMNLSALNDETVLKKTEAIINGMTKEERENPEIIDGSRKKRIARGSGVSKHDINVLLKNFKTFRKMMKGMKNVKSIDQIMKLR
jgi:signal recognition particle subunit SRP54